MCVFITTGSTKKSYKDHFMRTHVKASPQNTNKENDIHLWPRGSALSGEVPLRGSRSRRAAAGAEPCGLRASAGQGGGGSGAGSPRRRGRRLRRRCPSWTGFAHYPPSAPAPARRTHARGTPPAPLKGSDDETREPSPNKAPEPPRTPVTRREDRAESPADPTARPGPARVRCAERRRPALPSRRPRLHAEPTRHGDARPEGLRADRGPGRKGGVGRTNPPPRPPRPARAQPRPPTACSLRDARGRRPRRAPQRCPSAEAPGTPPPAPRGATYPGPGPRCGRVGLAAGAGSRRLRRRRRRSPRLGASGPAGGRSGGARLRRAGRDGRPRRSCAVAACVTSASGRRRVGRAS